MMEKAKKLNSKIICIIILLVITLLYGFNTVLRVTNVSRNVKVENHQINLMDFASNGYQQNYENYITVSPDGDANISKSDMNIYIQSVDIYFTNSPKNTAVQLYFSNSEHLYNEQTSELVNIQNNCATIYVNHFVNSLRLDIANEKNDTFSLDKIIINSSQNMRNEKVLIVFENTFKYGILIIFILALYLIYIKKYQIHKIYLFIGLLIGIIYLMIITPLSVPDETHHYHSSLLLSNYFMFDFSGKVPSQYVNYTDFVLHHNVSSAYSRVINDLFLNNKYDTLINIPKPFNLSYPIEYLPQAIALTFCRIFNLSFIFTFYFGRLFNLLFYIIAVYFSIKRIPKFKTLIFVVGLLPMSLHQAASYSYDGFINATSILVITYLVALIIEKNTITFKNKDYRILLVFSALLAPAKIVYSVILLFALCIPKENFENKKSRIILLAVLFLTSVFTISIFEIAVILAFTFVNSNLSQYIPYSISYILYNPLETIKIYLNTIKSNGEWLFNGSIGRYLSGLTLTLPYYISDVFTFLLLASVTNTKESIENVITNKKTKITIAFINISIFILVLTIAFISWTPNTSGTILGVQGRYFIPIIPLVFLFFNNRTLLITKNIDKTIMAISIFMQIPIVFNIINYTLVH